MYLPPLAYLHLPNEAVNNPTILLSLSWQVLPCFQPSSYAIPARILISTTADDIYTTDDPWNCPTQRLSRYSILCICTLHQASSQATDSTRLMLPPPNRRMTGSRKSDDFSTLAKTEARKLSKASGSIRTVGCATTSPRTSVMLLQLVLEFVEGLTS